MAQVLKHDLSLHRVPFPLTDAAQAPLMKHQPSSNCRDLRNKITLGTAAALSLPASPVAAGRLPNTSLI